MHPLRERSTTASLQQRQPAAAAVAGALVIVALVGGPAFAQPEDDLDIPSAPDKPADAPDKKPDTKRPDNKAPDAKAPDTKRPDSKAPDKPSDNKRPEKAPDNKAPGAKAPDVKAPDNNAPGVKAPDAKAPDAKAPDNNAPDNNAPDNNAPDTAPDKPSDTKRSAPDTKRPATDVRSTDNKAPSEVDPSLSLRKPGALASLVDASGIELRGYVQAQGQVDQQSQDQLMQGGAQLNQDGFVVRRARVALARTWNHAALAIELDANTVAGATVGLRRAEAALQWPARSANVPLAAIAVGLTDIPFGRELIEPSQQRLFMERSTASLAFFPGEPDIGARAWGGVREFRYAIALLAGEPINERNGFNRPDPNAAKDLVGRVGVEVAPTEGFAIAGGVSIVAGKGFHPGRDATKDTLEWRDLNENGGVELGELFSVPGSAAIPSENFRRWALGADVAVAAKSRLGWTRVAAEVTVASNLDRGLFVADPIVAGSDIRHLGAYASVTQDLGSNVFAGARLDYYDPNLDAFDSRSGMLVPLNETITTLSPLVGARLPKHLRATLQYDLVLDNLARDGRGVPTDLANNRFTARLQVDL